MSLQLHRPDGKGGIEPRPVAEPNWRAAAPVAALGHEPPRRQLPELQNPEMNPTSTGMAVLFWLGLGALTFVCSSPATGRGSGTRGSERVADAPARSALPELEARAPVDRPARLRNPSSRVRNHPPMRLPTRPDPRRRRPARRRWRRRAWALFLSGDNVAPLALPSTGPAVRDRAAPPPARRARRAAHPCRRLGRPGRRREPSREPGRLRPIPSPATGSASVSRACRLTAMPSAGRMRSPARPRSSRAAAG